MGTSKTILTDEEVITIGQQVRAIESGGNGYILPIAFARAIEQSVLQSPEIQALRKDAERYRRLRRGSIKDVAVVRGLDAMDYGSSGVASTYSEEIDGDDLDAATDSANMKMGTEHESENKSQRVTCTACQWEGSEDDLGYFEDDDEEYCPACINTKCLIDTDILEQRLKMESDMEKLTWRSGVYIV